MRYEIRALSADHAVTRLLIEAADEADARRQTSMKGLFAAEIAPARRAVLPSGRVKVLSLLLFSQELLALLSAGLSIVESIEALLEREAKGAVREILSGLLQGLRDGKRFSAVLAEQPALFPPLYVGIVRSAEGTSDLPRALMRYIDYQQRIDLLRNKVVSAAIYPAILLLVGGAVCLFLVGYVVPRFAEVYQDAGRELPWLSEKLLAWGRLAANHPRALVAGALALVALLAFSVHRFVRGGGASRFISRLPGVGERVRIYALSRLYLTLGMLLEGGIPLASAIGTVQRMVSPDLGTRLSRARTALEAGSPLSVALEDNGLTTPISLRMIRVGERSGELGRMLSHSATFYDGEISRWIDRFTRALEPLLMTAIGIVVGTIVVLLYMPIFDLAGSLP